MGDQLKSSLHCQDVAVWLPLDKRWKRYFLPNFPRKQHDNFVLHSTKIERRHLGVVKAMFLGESDEKVIDF